MEIFNLNSKFDVEHTIKQLKGRKKSPNICIKSEPKISITTAGIFEILEWSEIELAKQLTIISQQLFFKIEYKELLSAKWTKKDKYTASPKVMAIIDRFNKLSLWIIEEIISYDKKSSRAAVIEKFIRTANECRKLSNFNDCVNIISALNSYIIKNMKNTMKVINKDALILLEELNSFCSCARDYANLRNATKNISGKPCIPYLGLLLKELAFLEEGQKYINENYLINIDKIKIVYKSIELFMDYRGHTYQFRPIEQLSILSDPHPKTEDELEELANKIGIKIILIN